MFNVIIEFLNPDNVLNKTPFQLFKSYKPFKIEYKQNRKKYGLKRKWWQVLLGYCPWCCTYYQYDIRFTRRNCCYADEQNNWITGCKYCREADFEYFDELWKDYTSIRY